MKRKSLAASVLALALTAGAVVNAQSDSVTVDRAQVEEWQVQAQALADSLSDALVTTTAPPTTTTEAPTTTEPPTTTTTEPPTTTQPPTTTTQPPPTTTTLPPTTTTTQPLPIPSGEKFFTLIRLMGGTSPEFLWDAPYFRNLPYEPNTGWTDGDRHRYICMYAHLLLDGNVVGRVTFTNVPDANSYIQINDKFMVEGERYYDGRVAAPDAPVELHDCPPPDLAYEEYTGPDQRPTVVYFHRTLGALEFRNYKPLITSDKIKFQVLSVTPNRVTVVAYLDNLPIVAIYYDSLSPDVIMESDLGFEGP